MELPPLSPDAEATEQDDKPYDDNLVKEEKFDVSAAENKLLKK